MAVDSPSGDRGVQTARERHELPASVVNEPPFLMDMADEIIRLVRTWSHLKARMVSTVDPEVGSLFLLSRLIKDGPTRAKDLAEAMCADQSTVSRQVAALVRSGLVERQADPADGRASILVPTPSGLASINEHFAHRGHALEPLVADWSDAERQRFVEGLRRFSTALETRRDEVSAVMARSHTAVTAGHLSAAHPESGGGAEAHHDGAHSSRPTAQSLVEHVHPLASTERSH